MNKHGQSGKQQNEWAQCEMGFRSRNTVQRFLVGSHLQFWGRDFAHMSVGQ